MVKKFNSSKRVEMLMFSDEELDNNENNIYLTEDFFIVDYIYYKKIKNIKDFKLVGAYVSGVKDNNIKIENAYAIVKLEDNEELNGEDTLEPKNFMRAKWKEIEVKIRNKTKFKGRRQVSEKEELIKDIMDYLMRNNDEEYTDDYVVEVRQENQPNIVGVCSRRPVAFLVKLPGEDVTDEELDILDKWINAFAIAGVVHNTEEAEKLIFKRVWDDFEVVYKEAMKANEKKKNQY